MNARTVARRLEKGQMLYRVDFEEGDTLFYYSNRRKRGTRERPRTSRVVTRKAATRIAVHWSEEKHRLAPGDSHEDNPQGGWRE